MILYIRSQFATISEYNKRNRVAGPFVFMVVYDNFHKLHKKSL